jgi:hypothetical protein
MESLMRESLYIVLIVEIPKSGPVIKMNKKDVQQKKTFST